MKTKMPPILVILMLLPSLHAMQSQPTMFFDYTNADAMMKVIQGLHDHIESKAIEEFLDEALAFQAYKVSHERYNDPDRSRENRVTLSQFRSFMLSLTGEEVDTQENRRLIITKPLYKDAVTNPEKFRKALQKIHSVPPSHFQDAFKVALHWLPEEPDFDIYVWMLFDIGGSGAWAFRTDDGRHHVGFNLLHMLDEKGEFDIDLFLGVLAHEIHHLGSPLSRYYEAINYGSLDERSRLKLYSDYMDPLVTEGAAQKFCNNAPGALSAKPYPEKVFAATQQNLSEWAYFQAQYLDIHNRAVKDLRQLLSGTAIDMGKFRTEYDNYWTWKAGEIEGRQIMLGRQYYYGTELLGVINATLGRDALISGMLDIRKMPALYNEGIQKLRPKDFSLYLFPEDIIKIIQGL
jgi:hypothetical protein